MDIIKTILKLSFFLLGCIMLMFTLLVIPVGYTSVLFFLGFSLLFFILGYQYTFLVLKKIFGRIRKILHINRKSKNEWVNLYHENLSYNVSLKEIKLNTKNCSFDQIVSIELIANSKVIDVKELKKLKKIKSLEIKIGTKIKKVTYRHFKYVTSSKITDKVLKRQINNSISDYEKLNKILKIKSTKKNKTKKL